MLIKSIRVTNLLSFGPNTSPLDLGALNVLIGPNGSGKSNLLEVFGLLQTLPRELSLPGGVHDWLWKGRLSGAEGHSADAASPGVARKARIEALVLRWDDAWLRYCLTFEVAAFGRAHIVDERIEDELALPGHEQPYFYFRNEHGRSMFNIAGGEQRVLKGEDIDPTESILSQRKDPHAYPEVTTLGQVFSAVRLYREWNFGRHTSPRIPQPADQPNLFLAENAANLGLVLNRLRRETSVHQALVDELRVLYDGIDDFEVQVEGGRVQLFLRERGLTELIPATRLSDGTLRWLCLLAILLHPDPPAIVCIDEPEIGLHPDLLPRLADLMRDASERSQLVVTTHSDALVDALNDTPESVIVCEKHEGGTVLRRLRRDALEGWLEKYTLGELWRSGEIGGNRW